MSGDDFAKSRANPDRLDDQPDHVTAITSAARVERALTSSLKHRLRYDRNIYTEMFQGAGPLSTFDAKINAAFLFGLAEMATIRQLKVVCRIAKRFGERFETISFLSPPIQALVDTLATSGFLSRPPEETAAERVAKLQFIAACSRLVEMFSTTPFCENSKRVESSYVRLEPRDN